MSSAKFNVYLVPDEKFSTLRTSTVPPRPVCNKDRHVLIIGGSVTALTFAPADPRVTGQIAGALWEVPPAVCGQHTDPITIEKSKIWHHVSWDVFTDLHEKHKNVPHGVRIPMANFFFTKSLTDPSMEGQVEKMEDIRSLNLPGFRHDPSIIKEHAVNQHAGVMDAYQHRAPVIDTDTYLVWLRQLVEHKGGVTKVIKPIRGDLMLHEAHLLRHYKADAILNATGLASKDLASDPLVYPIRGCLLRVKNDGKRFPKVNQVLAVSNTDTKKMDDIVFIVPRNDDTLLLGGSVEPDEWNLDLTLKSELVKKMKARCENFIPGLKNAEPDEEAPLVQGLRPFRVGQVRIEVEERKYANGSSSRIVHSYGHGGSGFTLSFGCAMVAFALLDEVCHRPSDSTTEETITARL